MTNNTERTTRHGLQVDLSGDPGPSVSEAVGGLVYRVVREALRNVENHASASHVWVRVVREGAMILTEVVDDGVGLGRQPPNLDPSPGRRHFGLPLLRALLRDLDGTLAVSRRHGGGTVLQARVSPDLPG